jgi:probable lipoprotein NlpC
MQEISTIRQLIVLLILSLLLEAGCSSMPSPSGHQLPRTDRGGIREQLNRYFLAWQGVPYKIGGNDKRGIDCSGFVHLAYKNALGITVPRSTKLLQKAGKDISRNQLAVGDLVFFKTGFAKQHVGIYMGNGQFIHASTSRGVMKSTLKSSYWSKHYWKSIRAPGI